MIPYSNLGHIIDLHATVFVTNGLDVLYHGRYARTPEDVYFNAKVIAIRYDKEKDYYIIEVER